MIILDSFSKYCKYYYEYNQYKYIIFFQPKCVYMNHKNKIKLLKFDTIYKKNKFFATILNKIKEFII
jgi:hypothetical protein